MIPQYTGFSRFFSCYLVGREWNWKHLVNLVNICWNEHIVLICDVPSVIYKLLDRRYKTMDFHFSKSLDVGIKCNANIITFYQHYKKVTGYCNIAVRIGQIHDLWSVFPCRITVSQRLYDCKCHLVEGYHHVADILFLSLLHYTEM